MKINWEKTSHFIASFAAHSSSDMGDIKREQKEEREGERNKDVYVCFSYMSASFSEERCRDSFSYVSPKVPSIVPYTVETKFLPNVIERIKGTRVK